MRTMPKKSEHMLEPYSLPVETHAALLALAQESDVLFIGEIHGTQEIPRCVATLLPSLAGLGYQALGLEIPRFVQSGLQRYLRKTNAAVPSFFAKPWQDGRGSQELLSLAQRAAETGF